MTNHHRNSINPSVEAAHEAGLRYVTDHRPGIRRLRSGKGFRYVDPNGRAIRNTEVLERIRSLVIPPAWEDVWICPVANGHIQATGLDERGRKQYRYHARWRAVRDETKYHRLLDFGLALPSLRRRVRADLKLPGLPRAKVLATVVCLLETTLIRIGNEEYARTNHSFGLTTLLDRHARIEGATIHFTFRGKSGVKHAINVHDRRLARLVKRCRDLPGQELFQYLDEEGEQHNVDSADVNAYLQEICGDEFTAKDFRTWGGTILAAEALRRLEPPSSMTEGKRIVVETVAMVAEHLGNTRAVCRKCYIHPDVLDLFLEGGLLDALGRRRPPRSEEAWLLAFLRRRSRRTS
jgi:DNA topoisomerase-1